MRPEIEEWYASKKLPIDRIIDIGMKRHGIPNKEAILLAIEQEYEWRMLPRIKPILFKDISIAWEVWKRAREIMSANRIDEATEKYLSDKSKIEELSQSLQKVTNEYASLVNNFDSRVKVLNDKRAFKDRIFYWSTIGIMLAYIVWISGVF